LPLTLSIGVLPVASLNSPILTDAVDGVLDVTKLGANAVIRARDWPLIAINQQVWMRLSGKKADGTEHKLDIWSGGASFVNPTWFAQKYWPRNVAKSYFTELADNSPLTLSFKAALDQSGIEANAVVFADQVYTVKAFEVVAPTITEAKDSKGVLIPQGGITVDTSVTLTGTASKGQSVKILDGTTDKGDAVADPVTGIWTKILTGLSLAPHSFTAKALYGSGETSAARTLTVTATVAPTITEAKDSKGAVIPHGGTTVDTSVTLTGTASKGLSVKILDGTVDKGDAVADPVTGIWTKILTGLSLAPHSFTAKALYGSGETSAARTLTVTAMVAPTITLAEDSKGDVIPQGGTTVDTSVTLTGTASKNHSVKILDGTTDKGDAVADPATGIWTKTLTGLSLAEHSFTAKALYGTGQTSAARTVTVTAVVVPEITSVKDGNGGEILNGETTAHSRVTLSGSASRSQKVQLLDGATVVGVDVDVDADGNWTQEVSELSAGGHSFTAKALYGSNPVSAPPRVFTVVVPVLSEDFERYPIQYQLRQLDTPAMRIYVVTGASGMQIGTYILGKTLGFQAINEAIFDFKFLYSEVKFIHTRTSTREEVHFFDKDDKPLGSINMGEVPNPGTAVLTFNAPNIKKMKYISKSPGLYFIAFDSFEFKI
ncbi:hypothetical protein ABE529_25135, partial [Pseudomonas koreensis]